MIHILKICLDGEWSKHSWILSVGYFYTFLQMYIGLPRWCIGKEFTCQCRTHRRQGLIPGSRRSSWGGNGNPLQYSCLENSMDKGALRTTIHRVTSSQTWLSTHRHTDTQENKWGAHFQITQVHALWPSNFTSLYSSNRYTCTFACTDTTVNSIYIRTE